MNTRLHLCYNMFRILYTIHVESDILARLYPTYAFYKKESSFRSTFQLWISSMWFSSCWGYYTWVSQGFSTIHLAILSKQKTALDCSIAETICVAKITFILE
ncbi:hypothetical protein ACJX0J_022479 [Zea mays]